MTDRNAIRANGRMTDFNGTARKIARSVRGCTTDAQYADLLVQIEDALREASDRALKQEGVAAGLPEARSAEHSSSSSPQVITEVIKLMDKIGCDWRDAGDMQKFYATNYLVEAIRSALSPEEG